MVSNSKKTIENDTYENTEFDGSINNIFEEESVKVSIATFLSVFLLLSVVGNVCTCVVIVRNKSMRSPTNYYLLNMAISDLVFSIFIPIEIYMYQMSDISEKGTGLLFHVFMFNFLSNCSVLTILAFTVERYLAITKPILRRNMLASRVFKIITIIWTASGSFSCLNLYLVYKIKKRDYASFFTTYFNEFHRYYVGVLLTVFFVLPMCIITVLFVLIVLHMNSSETVLRTNSSRNIKNKNKAIHMLAAVAASFFICWSPFYMLRAMLLMKLNYEKHKCVWNVIIYLASVNSYMSAVVNPVLYSLMSRKFRQAFKMWRLIVYLYSINSYMSTVVNPILLYSLMSWKFRKAFKDLLEVIATRSEKSSKSHSRENTGNIA